MGAYSTSSYTTMSGYLTDYKASGENSKWGLNLAYLIENSEYDDSYWWGNTEDTALTARTVNKINLTGYSKLICNFYGAQEGSGNIGGFQKAVIGICTGDSNGEQLINANNYYKKIMSGYLPFGGETISKRYQTLTLDLTNVVGEYYVCFSILSHEFAPGSYGQSFYKMILN